MYPFQFLNVKFLHVMIFNMFAFIENFYEQIIFAIKTASKHLFESKHKQTNKFIYGWNNNVKITHATARANYLNWIKNDKIRNGKYYKAMKSS